ncbi:LuxR family transcriptional regulator [Streptomyces sp. NPDC046557]|uniref:LuxR family transcriptional regulator n=1 Tax=Streptomyces sp. NPDC046557 TaxID=3155372 RepID=UPI00340DCB68
MLTLLGVGEDADIIYKEMLRNPTAGISEIALKVDWDDARVRRGMDELARLSLVTSSRENPAVLRVADPRVGLSSLLRIRESEVQQSQRDLEASRLALEGAISEYASIVPSSDIPLFEQLDGPDSIRLKIEALVAGCESEIMEFVSPDMWGVVSAEAIRAVEETALERGVRIRSIGLGSIPKNSDMMHHMQWLARSGAQVRIAPTLPPHMVIYDRQTAIMPVDPASARKGALVLEGSGIVAALCELFEQFWSTAAPIGIHSTGNADELMSQQQAILTLLSRGHTDEAIARRLGVSVRTSRRMTAGIASQLRAKSRFQMGVEAALRGWVGPDEVGRQLGLTGPVPE